MHGTENIISFKKISCTMAIRSNMTLNNITADPLNIIFLNHYQNHIYSIFYHQGGPGTTIGFI